MGGSATGFVPNLIGDVVWSEFTLSGKERHVVVPHTGQRGQEAKFVLHAICWPAKPDELGTRPLEVRLTPLEAAEAPPPPPPAKPKKKRKGA